MLAALCLGLLAQGLPELGIGSGEPLPQDWQAQLLQEQAPARALALRLAQTGLPLSLEEADAAALLEAPEPGVRALLAAALLAPSRVTGRPPLPEARRARACALLVDRLLHAEDEADPEVLAERVRPWLRSGELEALAAALEQGTTALRHRTLSLLEAAPYAQSRPFLLRLALSAAPAMEPEERARCGRRLLLADGRAALEPLRPLLQPDAPDLLLRRLLDSWEPILAPEDLPALARIADHAAGPAGTAALLLWARHEGDPEQRARLFERALQLDPDRRGDLLEALTRGGPDPLLAQRLLELADSPRLETRQGALRLLPRVAGAQQLYTEYHQRAQTTPDPEHRGAWMVELARLPVPEAQREAADWLAGGGWEITGPAVAVARALRDSPEAVAGLDRLFRIDAAPDEVLVPLALGHAASMEVARAYLRRALESGPSPRRGEAIRALAQVGEPQDVRLLLDLARDPGYSPSARAMAIRSIAGNPAVAPRLLELLEEPPEDYEVAEALVRGLAASADPELRQRGRAAAQQGLRRESAEERQGLRLAAWQEQAERPAAGEAPELAGQLAALLQAAAHQPAPAPGVPLPDPLELARDHPEIQDCARALAAALLGPDAGAELPEAGFEPLEPVPAGALWLAASRLELAWPEAAHHWCQQLAGRPEVHRSARVRAWATCARSVFRPGTQPQAPALAALLARPTDLLECSWDLAHGIGRPGARAWVLPVDQLADAYLLQLAAAGPAEARAGRLEAFAAGDAAAPELEEAADLAAQAPPVPDLALTLARLAADAAPEEPRPRLLWGRALQAAGDPPAARAQFQAAARLAPEGSELWKEAQDALEQSSSD